MKVNTPMATFLGLALIATTIFFKPTLIAEVNATKHKPYATYRQVEMAKTSIIKRIDLQKANITWALKNETRKIQRQISSNKCKQ